MSATPEQVQHYRKLAEEAQRSSNRGWRARVHALVAWALLCEECDTEPCECLK